MNYIVYKTTNLINGKIYVGVHYTNPDIFDGYIGCGVSKKDQKKKVLKGFPAAVKKYGYENFKRETLFVFPDSEAGKIAAFKKEEEIVNEDFVKSATNYNLSLGGKAPDVRFVIRKISQYTLDGVFIRTWDSIEEAQMALNLNSLRNCVLGKSRYCGDWQWKYYSDNTDNIPPVKKKEKSIFQFDLSGNLLKSYKSITEAAKLFQNMKSAKVAISKCCVGKSCQSLGYYWSYKREFNYNPINKHLSPVAKYNDDGVFLESYSSVADAARENGIGENSAANIIAAIQGKHKHCAGFRWRYFYGNTCNIKPLR